MGAQRKIRGDANVRPARRVKRELLKIDGKSIECKDRQMILQACLDAFRLIDGQRVRFRDGVRVHGYVTNGGQAVNIIPELAA